MHIRVGVKKGDVVGTTNRELQIAVDALKANGGGVLEIGPGVYEMMDSLHLCSGIHVKGEGKRTVLRKCDGPASPLIIDADYGQLKLTPKSVKDFKVGMGVSVGDEKNGGWHTTVSRIVAIEKRHIYVADHLVSDYCTEHKQWIRNAVSVVSGINVEDVVIEGLTVDGNRKNNEVINGCRGGAIYLHKAKRCRISDCAVRNWNGDGISFQITQDITVEDCVIEGVTGLGLHPGTGSVRPVIRRCRMERNRHDGFFLCWRMQEGLIEDCIIRDNVRYGISIGHKDTDNVFRNNTITGNGLAGVHFRDEKKTNAGSRNMFEGNLIEGNGRKKLSPAVEILGETSDLVFVDNTIRPGKAPGRNKGQRVAFYIGPKAERPMLRGNTIAKHLDGTVETAQR